MKQGINRVIYGNVWKTNKKMQLKDGAEPFEQLRQEACYFFKKLEAA